MHVKEKFAIVQKGKSCGYFQEASLATDTVKLQYIFMKLRKFLMNCAESCGHFHESKKCYQHLSKLSYLK